jgi:hypothetical protein
MEFFAIGSDVYLGVGATVAASTTWAGLGCIVNVTPNTITRTFKDVPPCLNATNRKVKKRPHTIDYGSYVVKIRFDATKYDTVKTLLETGVTKGVAVVLGDTTKAKVATCYVESLGIPDLNEESEVEMDITFLINDDDAVVASSTIIGS